MSNFAFKEFIFCIWIKVSRRNTKARKTVNL